MLVEGPSKRDPTMLTGRTRQGKLVHFARPPAAGPPAGAFADGRVTGAAPHHLTGELVALTAGPPPRPDPGRRRLTVGAG